MHVYADELENWLMNAKVVGNSSDNDSKLRINVHEVKHGNDGQKNSNGRTTLVFFLQCFLLVLRND